MYCYQLRKIMLSPYVQQIQQYCSPELLSSECDVNNRSSRCKVVAEAKAPPPQARLPPWRPAAQAAARRSPGGAPAPAPGSQSSFQPLLLPLLAAAARPPACHTPCFISRTRLIMA